MQSHYSNNIVTTVDADNCPTRPIKRKEASTITIILVYNILPIAHQGRRRKALSALLPHSHSLPAPPVVCMDLIC
jgi:hypothetical protein